MTREAIVKAASKMETTHDLLVLLNRIKMDELGDKGHPFTMPQLNYFINPKRNKASYKTFTIPKKSGGVREISAPVKMLKSFQTYVSRILQAIYQAPECVTGFVPAKSVVDNAERHVGMRYVFNTDLKDFFPSISQARVWGALKTRPFSFPEVVASAIAGLCCIEVPVKGGKPLHVLPQGSPCSPVLTNIVCHNLDWKLNGLAKRFHMRYSRYADDITFSSEHYVYQEDGEFMKELRTIVEGQRFTFNDKKTRLQKRGERQEVTGLVVSDKVNVAREYVRDLDNLLYIWERHGHNAAFAKFISRYVPKQNLHSFGSNPDMKSVIMGKLMYLKMVKGEDSPVWNRLQKQFNRLADRKESAGGTDIKYIHAYTIDTFEKAVGTTISFIDEEGYPHPSFTVKGAFYSIRLSRYMETRLKNVLESGSEEQLKKFREKYHIGYCHREGDPEDYYFWMIFRRPPKDKVLVVTDIDELRSLVASTDGKQAEGLSVDETLDELIASGFDLNTLDKWDKTKRN